MVVFYTDLQLYKYRVEILHTNSSGYEETTLFTSYVEKTTPKKCVAFSNLMLNNLFIERLTINAFRCRATDLNFQ